MKVFRRIIIKILILLLIIAVFGGAAVIYRSYPYSSPDSVLDIYLTLLIEGDSESAYDMLDQSENTPLTPEEYDRALQILGYAAASSYEIEEPENSHEEDADSYSDYHVKFLDESGDVLLETDFSVKEQSSRVFGILNLWKVLSGHCMVTDLGITVPAGSVLYLDGEEAGISWLSEGETAASRDCYRIPSLFPDTVNIVIRHPILESCETTLEPTAGDADYCDQMSLKESAAAECEELAVNALKQIYVSAVKDNTDNLEKIFTGCMDEAQKAAEYIKPVLYRENGEFDSVGVYDYEAGYTGPVFTDEDTGDISIDMSISYSYTVWQRERVETGEIWADGTMAWEIQKVPYSGRADAEFTMSWYEDEWHVTSVSLSEI